MKLDERRLGLWSLAFPSKRRPRNISKKLTKTESTESVNTIKDVNQSAENQPQCPNPLSIINHKENDNILVNNGMIH